MGKTRVWIAVGCWLFAGAVFAGTQTRKPDPKTRQAGLWEVSTTMTWQRSPFDPGTASDMAKGGTHTRQVCLTQEMIDKYGALLPQSHGQCHIANKVMRPGGMTANWVCGGNMSGTGTLETNWSDLEHSSGKLHFVGTYHSESDAMPVEWTTESTSKFESADCGSVKPMPLPESPR